MNKISSGGGEMGALIRGYNWSATPIGPLDAWPVSLRVQVSLMLHSRFPMLIFWGPELITFYNDAFRPSLGNEGKHPSSLGQRGEQSWAESWPVIGPMIHDIMAGGEAVWFEDQKLPIYREGQMGYAYWTYSFSPLIDDVGAVNGILVTCSETTKAVESVAQLQKANAELQWSLEQNQLLRQAEQVVQQQLLGLFEQSPVAIATIHKDDLVFQTANPFYGSLVGRKPEELVGQSLLDALPELQGQGFDQLLGEVIATGEPFVASEVRVEVVRSGQLEAIYVDLAYQPWRDVAGDISGVLVVATDVTQQVLTRQRLQESTDQIRAMIESAPFPIGVYTGAEMQIRFANQAIIDVYGKGPDVIGKTYPELLPELAGQQIFEQLQQVYASGIAFASGTQRVNIEHQGQLVPYYFNYNFTPLLDAAGQVYGIMNTAADVTPLEMARQQLAESQAVLQNAIELAELATFNVNVVAGSVTVSQRLADWFGFEGLTHASDTFINGVGPSEQDYVRTTLSNALSPGSDGRFDITHSIINVQTGDRRVIRASGRVTYDAGGAPSTIEGTAQDITADQELQQVLERLVQQRTEEVAAINEELTAGNEELAEANHLLLRSNDNLQQFAYIASHDLQEPLRKIQSFGNILKEQYADELGQGVDLLERMQLAAQRMSILIRDLLTYSRISTQREAELPVSLNQIVEGVLNDLELVIQEKSAQVRVGPLPTIYGDSLQLGQLFQNLLSNALKFRRADSPPLIEVHNERVAAADLPPTAHPVRRASYYYRLDVVDNGIGFDEKYLERIFQVFQRLHGKQQYAGTGIGLAICEKVAANHGGAITAISQPGQGSVFSVYFPITYAFTATTDHS